jgi:hypothetical protein
LQFDEKLFDLTVEDHASFATFCREFGRYPVDTRNGTIEPMLDITRLEEGVVYQFTKIKSSENSEVMKLESRIEMLEAYTANRDNDFEKTVSFFFLK